MYQIIFWKSTSKKFKKKAQSKRKGGDNKVKKSIKFKTIEKNQSNLIKFKTKVEFFLKN